MNRVRPLDPFPAPPRQVLHAAPPFFRPAPEVYLWARETLIEEGAPLHNPEHAHLEVAHVGVLWAAGGFAQKGRLVVGTAEMFAPKGNAWQKGRQEHQLVEWFGAVPDFVVTLDAEYVAGRLDDGDAPAVMALLEHELLHCAQAVDLFGSPRFRKRDGRPVYTIRGHDVEEFVSVVRRYGAAAAGSDVVALAEAASRPPEIARPRLAGVCGTCLRRAA